MLFCLFAFNHWAYSMYPELRFKHIAFNEGLQNLVIQSVIQDYQGFIWVGTMDGLYKYDGNHFQVYFNDRNDNSSIRDNNISDIVEDASHNMWIGTNTGLDLYDRLTDSFIHIPIIDRNFSDRVNKNERISEYYTYYLHKDLNDDIYVGTRHKVLYKIDKENRCIKPFLSKFRFDENVVRSSDKAGNLWIATAQGAYRLNVFSQEIVHYFYEPGNPYSISSNQVFFIHSDSKNHVWIATDKGLSRIDGATGKMKTYLHSPGDRRSIPGYFIKRIYEDHLGNLWFCSENGLFRYNYKTDDFTVFLSDKADMTSLSTNRINTAFVDRQHILWIGTQTAGIDYAALDSPYGFETVHTTSFLDSNLPENEVTAIYKDSGDNLWIATNGSGLHCINQKTGKRKHYYHNPENPASISTNSILAIEQDEEGNLWFGGYYGGLNKFNKNRDSFSRFSIEENSPPGIRTLTNEIKNFIDAGNKELIIATNGGGVAIFNRDSNTFHFLLNDPHNPHSLCSNWCTDLIRDSRDDIWISTYYGLCRWNRTENTLTNYQTHDTIPHSIASNTVITVFEDSHRQIWAGTPGGPCRLNVSTGIFECFSRKEGFASDNIYGFLEDHKGNVWISTPLGISRFNPDSETIKTFYSNSDFQGSQFNYGSCHKDRDGMLYFGTMNGYVCINPKEVKDTTFFPPLYVTELQLQDKLIKPGDKSKILTRPISETTRIELNHRQSFITFRYVALNYLYSQHMYYAYILEGFDKEWHEVGSNRSATYTNLPPGNYIFKVKAGNEKNIWNAFTTGIEVIIKPPVWLTFWAYMLYTLLLFISAYAIFAFLRFRHNLKQQVEMQRIKAQEQHKLDLFKLQFFTNVSHELRTPLTLILGPAERLRQNISDKQWPSIFLADTIYRNAHRLLHLVNQLLDFRKLDTGSEKLNLIESNLVKYVQEAVDLFRNQAEHKKIELAFSTSTPSVIAHFDPDKIEKVLCNLISNAIKCTPSSGKIIISVKEAEAAINPPETAGLWSVTGNYLIIQVADNGIGIPDSEKPRIFDSFYQSQNYSYAKQDGSGIGLAITKEYINMHKGYIGVGDNKDPQATEKRGTIFTVYLPVKQIEDNHDAAFHQEPAATRHVNHPVMNHIPCQVEHAGSNEINSKEKDELPLLLIVEDNHDMRKFIRLELSDEFRITEAQDGKAGIRMAIEHMPDLVVSDIMMPDISGIELCKTLKTDLRTSHIPVIMLTALFEDEYKIEGLETGADDFLVKPFNTALFKVRIRNLIETRKQLQDKFKQSVGFNNKAAAVNSTDTRFMEKLFALVKQEMDNPNIDVLMITREIGMSKTQLYKKIKAITGQSLFEFIYTIRLKKAAEILLNEDVNVSEVASRVGFSNLSVFTRSFTRQFKINPSKYASIYNPDKKGITSQNTSSKSTKV